MVIQSERVSLFSLVIVDSYCHPPSYMGPRGRVQGAKTRNYADVDTTADQHFLLTTFSAMFTQVKTIRQSDPVMTYGWFYRNIRGTYWRGTILPNSNKGRAYTSVFPPSSTLAQHQANISSTHRASCVTTSCPVKARPTRKAQGGKSVYIRTVL